jgi:hypothetical protein
LLIATTENIQVPFLLLHLYTHLLYPYGNYSSYSCCNYTYIISAGAIWGMKNENKIEVEPFGPPLSVEDCVPEKDSRLCVTSSDIPWLSQIRCSLLYLWTQVWVYVYDENGRFSTATNLILPYNFLPNYLKGQNAPPPPS